MKPLSQNNSVDIVFASHLGQLQGGAEKSLLNLIHYLSKKNIKIHVIVPEKGELSKQLARIAVPFTVIGHNWWARGEGHDIPFIFTTPDHTHNTTFETIALLQKLNPRLCVTNTVVIPWLAYASAMLGIEHNWMIRELFGSKAHWLKFFMDQSQVIKTIDLLSNKIFTNSHSAKRYFEKKLTYNKDIGVIYPYVGIISPEKIKTPYKNGVLKLCIVGQIYKSKGQFDAIKATKKILDSGKDVQLAIVGREDDKRYSDELRGYINKHKLHDNIIFMGAMKNPASVVALSDIVIVSSVHESFGRVTVEAMLAGKPVVGANSGGTAEIIQHATTGLLYEPGDDSDLAKNILTLSEKNTFSRQIAKAGQDYASKTFSEEASHRDFLTYFLSMNSSSKYHSHSLDLRPLLNLYEDNRASVKSFTSQIESLQKQKDELQAKIIAQETEIRNIIQSKSWRLLRTIRKILPY